MNKKMHDLKIVFFGTPDFAVFFLEEILAAKIVPALIITTPDKPKGRGMILTSPPVKLWAQEQEIDVLQPEKITEKFVEELSNTEWDLFIVASYGKILPRRLIELPTYKTLNIHPSLLPKLRGASPIRSAILLDQKDAVGVTIMQIDEELDHGPIVAQASVELENLPESEEGGWPMHFLILEELLAREGGRLLIETIPLWIKGKIAAEEQKHEVATFSKKITKKDGEISLDGDPYQNFLKIRAFEGWPGTYFFVRQNSKEVRVKITDAEYEDGKLIITRVIPEGKKEMAYETLLRNLSSTSKSK